MKITVKTIALTAIAILVLTACGGETKKEFYNDGSLKFSAEYNSDSKLDGEYKSYYRNGNPEEEKEYSDGKLDGKYVSYFENGQIKKEMAYANNKGNGDFKSYYENGQLKSEGTYTNNTIDDEYTMYWEDGKIALSENYKDGKEDGVFKTFNRNGDILSSIEYSNGLLDGDSLYNIYINGSMKKSVFAKFKDGVLVNGYAFPLVTIKGFGFRRTTTKLGNKIALKTNSDFKRILQKNEHINLFDKVIGLK